MEQYNVLRKDINIAFSKTEAKIHCNN